MAFFQYPTPSLFGSGTFTGTISTTGIVGFGGATSTSSIENIGASNPLTGANQRASTAAMTTTSAATGESLGYFANITTANSPYTTPIRAQFYASNRAKGAASTITRDVSYYTEVPSQGTSNAVFADNVGFSGNFVAHFTSTRPSLFTGALSHARADVASAATITALASTNGFVRLTGATATSLQGITAGVDGQVLRLFNNTAANMTIQHENAGATAANRITTMTGADIATTANGFAEFIYDTGSSRWICMYVSA